MSTLRDGRGVTLSRGSSRVGSGRRGNITCFRISMSTPSFITPVQEDYEIGQCHRQDSKANSLSELKDSAGGRGGGERGREEEEEEEEEEKEKLLGPPSFTPNLEGAKAAAGLPINRGQRWQYGAGILIGVGATYPANGDVNLSGSRTLRLRVHLITLDMEVVNRGETTTMTSLIFPDSLLQSPSPLTQGHTNKVVQAAVHIADVAERTDSSCRALGPDECSQSSRGPGTCQMQRDVSGGKSAGTQGTLKWHREPREGSLDGGNVMSWQGAKEMEGERRTGKESYPLIITHSHAVNITMQVVTLTKRAPTNQRRHATTGGCTCEDTSITTTPSIDRFATPGLAGDATDILTECFSIMPPKLQCDLRVLQTEISSRSSIAMVQLLQDSSNKLNPLHGALQKPLQQKQKELVRVLGALTNYCFLCWIGDVNRANSVTQHVNISSSPRPLTSVPGLSKIPGHTHVLICRKRINIFSRVSSASPPRLGLEDEPSNR
ncbi:unnamed protein product [Pleuronectes platessa]|uniref:Uncharacterized protein n=1 Tax=Pleuronectes platessa TaxID=8262 RepID=A0A9N7UVQ0_PLEPL|nr:unnamed protein product [Pleuronectes platessa]